MKKILYFIIVCIITISCDSTKSELNRTIFIPDADDSNLPAYTEWGYNCFGAIYENSYFLASTAYIPCKIMYQNDSLRLLLTGVMAESVRPQKVALTFVFPCEPIDTYADLLSLHKREVDLKTEGEVIMTVNDIDSKVLEIVSGDFTFKRVQLLSVDDKENRAIISGTFNLTYRIGNGFANSFSDGRFDFGIDKLYNF